MVRWKKKKKKTIPVAESGALCWIRGGGSANGVFLLTFNSPKHACFTAPGAIAFLNLSLERQELWSLSIEEKGMLFPCHPLVAPPSSMPWSTAWVPPYPSLPPSYPLCFVVSCRLCRCHGLLRWEWEAKCTGGEVAVGGGCGDIGFEGAIGSGVMVVVVFTPVLP